MICEAYFKLYGHMSLQVSRLSGIDISIYPLVEICCLYFSFLIHSKYNGGFWHATNTAA
jgi:hypothetical protein